MATRTLKKKVQAKPATSKLAAPVLGSARDLWLAGIGAIAVVQQESSRLFEEGGRLFGRFVEEGARFEHRTRDMAEETVEEIRGSVESTVEEVRKQATGQLDRLEHTFGFSVSDALNRLGIPTTGDLDEVSVRLQKMTSRVNENWKSLNKAIDGRVRAVLGDLELPAAEDLNRLAERLQKFSRETVENLVAIENAFEKRVPGILQSMDIPTRDEMDRLAKAVAELDRHISRLEKVSPKNVEKAAASG